MLGLRSEAIKPYCFVRSITPTPWQPYIYGVCNVWVELSIPSPLPWELPQSRLHLQESIPNDYPSPERVKTTPIGYLNCPPENKYMASPVLHPPLRVLPEGHLGALASIKPGLLLIRSDLVWFGLLRRRRGLSGWKNLAPIVFSIS